MASEILICNVCGALPPAGHTYPQCNCMDFGKTSRFTPEDVVGVELVRHRVARRLTKKLRPDFVPRTDRQIADAWRAFRARDLLLEMVTGEKIGSGRAKAPDQATFENCCHEIWAAGEKLGLGRYATRRPYSDWIGEAQASFVSNRT